VGALDPQTRIAQLERELHEADFKIEVLKSVEQKLQWANLKIQVLEEQLRQRRIQMFGPKSETLNNLQLELLAGGEPSVTADEIEAEARREPVTKAPARERKTHPGRERLPEKLQRVEKVIPCTEQVCRACGKETAVIGYDESEQLDVEPARYFVRVIKREKRACRGCEQGTVTMALLEPRIVEKGLASDAVVVNTVVAKYCDHVPLYRQAVMLERDKWSARKSQLCNRCRRHQTFSQLHELC
jgi:transposase